VDLQEIDVFIDKDGQVRVEVRGVKGGACLDLTAALEQALGGKVEARELTPEAQEGLGQAVPESVRHKAR
jgi:hypothetical protein